MSRYRLLLATCMIGLGGTAVAAAPALPANITSAADTGRREQAKQDAKRHGPEILAFAGVRPGDKIADLIPGGGYWTRLLAKSVGPKGHVYGVWPAEYVKVDDDEPGPYRKLASSPGYENVTVIEQPAAAFATPETLDLVFTAQNYHDYFDKFMGPVDPAALNKAVFAALKPGGIYLVIDHVAETRSGHRDTDTLHRIDPVAVKAEVTTAGFRFVGESRLLANPADDHSKKVFDPAVRGTTDQFIYKFRKP